MSKNAYFLEKKCKIAAASGDPLPKPPLISGDWGLRVVNLTLLI